MVVAASKKDETVTTPLKKSLFRNYHPLFLLFFYSGITCHRYGKTGQPPKKFQHIAWNTVYAYFGEKSAILVKIHVFFMVIPKCPNDNSGLY